MGAGGYMAWFIKDSERKVMNLIKNFFKFHFDIQINFSHSNFLTLWNFKERFKIVQKNLSK